VGKVIGIYLSVAAALVIAGAVAGVLTVISLGIHREEPGLSLTRAVTDRAARGARQVNGLYARGPRLAYQPATAGAAPEPAGNRGGGRHQ
jgi:hypothetical protein